MNRLHLLLVDDRPELLRALTRVLRAAFHVTASPGLAPAIRVLAVTSVDVVLSDYEMPDPGEGLWLLATTRALSPTTRRLLMSGREGFEGEVETIAPGLVDLCLRKPFSAAEVIVAAGLR